MSGATTGPQPLRSALSLTLQSSPFPSIPSILPPSLCPQQSLSSSVFISLPLPPSVTFHVVTHYSTDISPSVPPSLPPFLPYWCWPSPPCLGLDGTEGEKAGEDVPDGRTLNSKRERKDGGMKEETKTRRGEDLWVCTKRWKRADRKLTDRPSLPEMTDERTNRHMQTTHPHSPRVSLIG